MCELKFGLRHKPPVLARIDLDYDCAADEREEHLVDAAYDAFRAGEWTLYDLTDRRSRWRLWAYANPP